MGSQLPNMEGRFQLVEGDDDNMDKILVATGFSEQVRKASRTIKTIVSFTRNGDNYVLTMSGGGKEVSMSIELGKEITEKALDGRVATSIFTRDPAAGLVQNETIKYERVVVGDQMISTVSHGGIVAKRVYKRL